MNAEARVQQMVLWREETVQEIEEARRDQAAAQRHVEQARERLAAIDRLLAVEGGSRELASVREEAVDLLDACERILRGAGDSMHVNQLHSALLEAGVPIPGKGTEANLIVRLTRSDGRFIRTGRGTYGLPEFGLPEVKSVKRKRRRKPAD